MTEDEIMKLEGADLDMAVAWKQGWALSLDGKNGFLDSWICNENSTILTKDYHPSTNMAQAMELQIKFRISVMWYGEECSGRYKNGIVWRLTELYKTPMEAICRAVVASNDKH